MNYNINSSDPSKLAFYETRGVTSILKLALRMFLGVAREVIFNTSLLNRVHL